MSIVIRHLHPEDTPLICAAAEGVFDHTPRESVTSEFLRDPRHHLVAALDADRVVGFVSAVHYIHPDKPAELWINEVGVAPACRKRGIARQLLEAMLAHGRTLGCVNAWVLTERGNAAAMRLYQSAGGKETANETVMWEFPLNP